MSQKQDIISHLYNIGPITPLDALKLYGCFRLATAIFDLKKDGYNINTEIVRIGKKHFAKYVLDKSVQYVILNQA